MNEQFSYNCCVENSTCLSVALLVLDGQQSSQREPQGDPPTIAVMMPLTTSAARCINISHNYDGLFLLRPVLLV